MFSGTTDVRLLRPSDVDWRIINDLNILLKQQHNEAKTVYESQLLDHMRESKIACAMNDGTMIGMGVLVRTRCVSHEFASIHNLIVRKGFDPLIIGKRLLELLIQDLHNVVFVEAGVWLQTDDLVDVLVALGFKEKPRIRYRLKLKRS